MSRCSRLVANETITFDSRHVRKDGTEFSVEVKLRPFVVDGERFTLALIRDISQHKQVEAKLREAQQRLAVILKGSDVGLWDWDVKTNAVTFSSEWKSQLGYADHEIQGHYSDFESRVHPDDLPPTLEKVKLAIDHLSEHYEAEFRMRHKDGSWRWILGAVLSFPIETAIPRACSERISTSPPESPPRPRSSKASSDSAMSLNTCPSCSAPPTIMRESPIWNKECERVSGFPAEEIVGTANWESILAPNAILPNRKQSAAARNAENTTAGNPHSPVATAPFAPSPGPIRRSCPKSLVGLAGRLVSTSRTRNAPKWNWPGATPSCCMPRGSRPSARWSRRCRTKWPSRSTPSGTSRPPATSCSPHSTTRIWKHCMPIFARSRNKANVAPQSCNVYAISADALPRDAQTATSRSLVNDAVELVANDLRRHDVRLNIDVHDVIPEILGDRVQLQQLIVNLLTNARDAVLGQSGDRRSISIRAYSERNVVLLEVADAGTGFSTDVATRLFEPFFTTKENGMGIGLSICQSIAYDHGGRVDGSSNRAGGASFRVQLPVSRALL